MSRKLNHHEALIYVMVTMAAVDRQITDEELAEIGRITSHLPVFRDFDNENLVPIAEDCGALLGQESGLDDLLKRVAQSLPPKLFETAYALAVEVAAVDLDIRQEELRFLELLRDQLDLDRLSTAAIERGARARHNVI